MPGCQFCGGHCASQQKFSQIIIHAYLGSWYGNLRTVVCGRSLTSRQESGKSISVDIPTTSALKFQERCIQLTSCANDSSSGTTPPTCTPNTGTTSSTSQVAGSSRQRQTQAAQSNRSNSAGSTSLRTPSISVNSNEKYIHWCVDSSRSETNLYHICVESPSSAKNGIEFISELRKSYKKSRGIRRLFSLTTCAEIKLVKVTYNPFSHIRGL